MNRPEIQMRWKWQAGDIAMWDNRITMHYAVADYLPAYRCMNRITVVSDKRESPAKAPR
jgi:taurine dioxygenase